MKKAMKMNRFVGVICIALATFAASADGTPWGWAIDGLGGETALTDRTGTGGACLTNASLAVGTKVIRFAKGTVVVGRIEIENRDLTFAGDPAGTTLKPETQSTREFGGAIQATGGSVTVTNLTFDGFYAESAGGALSLRELTGASAVVGCRFFDCRAAWDWGDGGAIFATAKIGTSVTLTLKDTTFADCSACRGGAVSTVRIAPAVEDPVTLKIEGCAFEGNESAGSGGALVVEGPVVTAGTTFEDNVAGTDGGAICAGSSEPGFGGAVIRCGTGTVFRGNAADDQYYHVGCGGAVALVNEGFDLESERAAFYGNEADFGGAVFAYTNNCVSLTTSVFSNNVVSADGIGGAISVQWSSCAFTNLTVRGSNRGAVDIYDSEAEVVNCVVVGNDDADLNVEGPSASLIARRCGYGVMLSAAKVTEIECVSGRTAADYDGDSLRLKGTPDYNPLAAEGIVQATKDFDFVDYGSSDFGYSMGAYECATVTAVSSEPFEGVYDGNGHTITVSSAVAAVPQTWTFATNSLGPWQSEMPAFTNVGVYWVWAKVSADVFKTPLLTSNTVTITSAPFEFTVDGYNQQYDGKPHGVTVDVDAKYGAKTYYSTDGVNWSDDKSGFAYTDVTNLTVYVKLETVNYGSKTGYAQVVVSRRDITFEGPKKTRPYNPALPPLTFDKSEISVGGQKYAENEEFLYDNFAEISEVGDTPAVFECFDNPATTPMTKVSNYNITILKDNLLKITASEDQLAVASLGNKWTYDGNAHGMGYEVYNRQNLISGDEIEVVLDGVKITYPGEATNTIKSVRILRDGVDVTANYLNLVVTTGTLQVVNADFKNVVATPVNRKYDGTASSIAVNPNEPLLAPNAVVTYSTDGVTYGPVNPAYSNVVNATVMYKVSAPYFNDFYGSSTVTITKRNLVFASADSSQVECDTTLVTDITKITETAASDGIVAGEESGITFTATGHAKTVAESGADATFDVNFDEVRAKSGNYTVKTVTGKLYISEKGKVTVYAPSKEFPTDCYGDDNVCHDEPRVDGLAAGEYIGNIVWDPASKITRPSEGPVPNVITSVTVYNGQDEVLSTYKITYVPGELTMANLSLEGVVSAKDIDKVYDNVKTNITVVVNKTKLVDSRAVIQYAYRTSEGSDWNSVNPEFKGVTDTTVYYLVTIPDYEPFEAEAQVTIAHRPVKLVSEGATRVYDGTPLTTNLVTVAEGNGLYGIAEGEFLCYACTGSQTEVGESKNFFDYWLTNVAGTAKAELAANYHFEPTPGMLKITGASLDFKYDGFSGPYDGQGHGPVLDDSELPAGYSVKYSTDGCASWQTEVPVFTNVTTQTVYAQISADNYEGVTVAAGVDIYPRKLLLVAPDLKRPYNGEELTFGAADIQAGGMQYATGECFKYSDFASITEVGRIKSLFTYGDSDDGKTKVSNYDVSIAPNRWLEVLPSTDKIVARSFSYYGKYDGKEHGADFEIIDNGKLVPGDRVEATLDGKTVKFPADGVVSNTFASVRILRGAEDVTDSYTNLVEVIGTLEVVPADLEDLDVEAVGVNRKYDGTEGKVKVTVKNELARDTATILYSTDGVTFTNENPSFTNVCDETVTYIVTDDNFNPYTNSVAVKIAKRTVCFKSKNDWKFYDGTPLTVADDKIVEVDGYDGFVAGEGVKAFVNRASITQKGDCEASFDVELAEGTLAGNYTVKTVFGKLSIYWSDGLIIVAGSKEFEYDGNEHVFHECSYLHLKDGDDLSVGDSAYVGSISRPDQSPVVNWIRRERVKVLRKGKDVTAEYGAFELVDGELTMEKLTLDRLVSAKDGVKVYDGEPTNITVSVDVSKLPAAAAASVKIRYSSLPNASFGTKNPTRTKVGAQNVYYYVSADGCVDSQVNMASIEISTRKVQLVSAGATKPYDGKVLVTNEVVCAKGEGLYALAKGDYLDATCNGSQLNVGESENTFTFAITNAANDVSLKDNYFVTFGYGKLVVTEAEQEKEDPPDPPEGALTPYDYIGMYDGNPHSITPFTVTKPTDAKIYYSTNGIDWTETKFFKTDVCRLENVWFKSVASNYTDIVTNGYITITNRPVTVTSASGSYVYNGQAQGTNAFTVTSGSFVDGENITAKDWATITTVAESGKNNTFTEIWNSRTKKANYLFKKEYGTLTMVPAAPPPPEDDDKKDPPPPPYIPGDDDPPPPPQDPTTGTILTFSDYDYVYVYDGKSHTLDTNKLQQAVTSKDWKGDTPIVRFSLTGKANSWKRLPFTFTDVVSTGFWYQVQSANHSNYVHAVGVTITNRPAKITFAASDKTYDGNRVATCVSTNFANVVKGESFALDTSSMQFAFDTAVIGVNKTVTATGYSDALVTAGANTKKTNYSFDFVTTAKASIKKDSGCTFSFKDNANNRYYTSEKINPGVTVRNKDGKVLGAGEYSVAYYKNIHATNSAVVTTWAYAVVTMTNNYAGVITNYFAIKPRALTFKTPSKTFVYNGASRSCKYVSIWGLQKHDAVQTNGFTTVKAVNAPKGVDNVFGYALKGVANPTDYAVTKSWGTLTVIPAGLPDPDPDPKDPEDPRDPKAGPFEGPDLPGPTVPPVPTNKVDGTWSKLSAYDVVTVYDGKAHTYRASALTNAIKKLELHGNPYTIDYSLTGKGGWQKNPFRFTNVAQTPTSFWYRVAVPNYTNYIHAVGVTITQRVVKVAFPTAVKTYDGTVAYQGVLSTNVVRGTHNMVGSEKFYATASGTFASESVGTPDFILTGVTLEAKTAATKFSNYRIYFGANGDVLFDPGDTPDAPGPHEFGPTNPKWPDPAKPGSPKPVSPGEIVSSGLPPSDDPSLPPSFGPFPGPDVPPGQALPPPYDPKDPSKTVKLSDYDVVTNYDGVAHTFNEAALKARLNTLALHGNKWSLSYSLTGAAGTWVSTPFSWTDAVATSFWYRVSAPNYTDSIHAVGVTVNRRDITLSSGTARRFYDGTPLTCDVVWVSEGRVVKGEGFAGKTTASQTAVGVCDNRFTYAPKAGTKASNYNVTIDFGTLEIMSATGEILKEIVNTVPADNGQGVIMTYLDNREAGEWASTNSPAGLAEIARRIVKHDEHDNDRVEIRLKILEKYSQSSFAYLTNAIVTNAQQTLPKEKQKDIARFRYAAVDLTLLKKYECLETGEATVEDIGDSNEQTLRVVLPIPKAITGKREYLRGFSLWRDHTVTNSSGVLMRRLAGEVPYGAPKPGDTEGIFYVTNDTSLVISAKKYSTFVINYLFSSTPQLKADIQWKYCQATDSFFGQLKVACTNGEERLIKRVRFLFQDRDEAYLWNWSTRKKLEKTVSYGTQTTLFRYAEADETFLNTIRSPANNRKEVVYGVSTNDWAKYASANIVPSASRKFSLWATSRPDSLDAVKTRADLAPLLGDYLGYVAWTVEGEAGEYWLPISGVDVAKLAEKGNPIVTKLMSTRTLAPLSVKALNRSVAYGVPVSDDSDPTLRIAAFSIDGNTVRGRVESTVNGVSGLPGDNAWLTILCATKLTSPYVEMSQVKLGKDGLFAVDVPVDARFFRVRLQVVDVIK